MKRNIKILLCFAAVFYSAIVTPWLSFSAEAVKYTKSPTLKADSEYVVFTEKNIKTEDLRKKAKLDEDKLEEYMKKFPNLSGIEDTLIEIQEDYHVNAILILAIVRLESGNGKSEAAQSRNNLGGIIVTEKSVSVYKSFDTRSDCIVYMAKLISENYLSEDGKYFNGYALTDIAKKYSVSPDTWSDLVSDMMLEIQAGIDKAES